jgi:peptidoglycan/LPS O-acetylase OafA/YrhL
LWSLRLGLLCAGAVAFLFMRQGGLHMDDPIMQGAGMTLVQLMLGAALVGALCLPSSGFATSVLSRGLLPVLGKYSYGIYVFHWMLNPLMIRYVTPHVPGEALAHFYVLHGRGTVSRQICHRLRRSVAELSHCLRAAS